MKGSAPAVEIKMETQRITLHQEDKTTTIVYASLSDISTPIGSVLLLHDMAEHHGRFDDFVKKLNAKGYDTYTYDQRGHGAEIRYEDLGFIAEENGYELLISDALHVLKYVKRVNRGKKIILFGAGMGALVARCLLPIFDSLSACILCSSPNPSHKKINSMMTSARLAKFSKKPRDKSARLGKKFMEYEDFTDISNRTSFDWVSRDNQLVGAYMSDPLCGFLCTISFYMDMLRLAEEAISRINLKQIRNDLPILLLAGSHDPVCYYGHDVAELFDTFQRYHLSEVDCTIYEECRHDLLHEINNLEIVKDILEWLNRALDNRRLKAYAAMKDKKKKKGRNRTAAEAARSALGYGTDEGQEADPSNADDDDDDDFLEDMGYFGRPEMPKNPEKEAVEEDEDFITADDEEDEDLKLLAESDAEDAKALVQPRKEIKDDGENKSLKADKKEGKDTAAAEMKPEVTVAETKTEEEKTVEKVSTETKNKRKK